MWKPIYNGKSSSYEALNTKDGSVYIHHRDIQALATESCKINNGSSPELVAEIFAWDSHYNIRWCNDFIRPSVRTAYHGSESISFFGPKIWNIFPDEIKQQTSPNSLKNQLKSGRYRIAHVYYENFMLMVMVYCVC